jgi:ABC-2 type transport system ATP-binding protein
MIQLDGLYKSYEKGTIKALQGISLEVGEGELFGLIGPDGAGKTTLIRILATLLLPDRGSASVHQLDVVSDFKKIRKIVGYMPGKFSLYQDLSVEENLEFFATVFNTTVQENYHLIKDIYVQLEPFKNRLAGKLSGGMKQKLALCCALIHEPRILLLDEPTTGVDPVSRKEFWDMLDRLKSRGISIFVSTPYMDEASRCDRIALIQKGKILDIDTLTGILDKNREPLWSIQGGDRYHLMNDLNNYHDTASCFAFGETLHVTLKSGQLGIQQMENYLNERKHVGLAIRAISPNIEDTFMKLMLESEKK